MKKTPTPTASSYPPDASNTTTNLPTLESGAGKHTQGQHRSNDGAEAPSSATVAAKMHSGIASQIIAPATDWYSQIQRQRTHMSASKRNEGTARTFWKIVASYSLDWVMTFLLAGLLALINDVYGFRREFSLTDTSIQHTFATSERVPVWLLVVLAVIVPIVIVAIVSLGITRSVWDFHASLLSFILTHAIVVTATTMLKVTVGRPRPDLIDRCQPAAGSTNRTPYGLATQSICTVALDSSKLRDGFRSFPSGHSSTAFAGLTFLSLYLAGKLHLAHRTRAHAATQWIVFFPMIGAALIAVSRTMDYRHHATDVIAGSILGAIIAFVTYFFYFPPLRHRDSHKPWAPRTSGLYHDGADNEYDEAGDALQTDLDDIERNPLARNDEHSHHQAQINPQQHEQPTAQQNASPYQ